MWGLKVLMVCLTGLSKACLVSARLACAGSAGCDNCPGPAGGPQQSHLRSVRGVQRDRHVRRHGCQAARRQAGSRAEPGGRMGGGRMWLRGRVPSAGEQPHFSLL